MNNLSYEELKKENEELKKNAVSLKEWVDRNQDEINRLRCVIDEEEEEDIEEQLAAVECLQFMDYTYKDGRWFDADCESEDESEDEEDNKAFAKDIVKGIIEMLDEIR